MEKFLVTAATDALSPVLNKLAVVLGDEYKRFKGVRGEVESLTEELKAMHAFLLKMSEENPDEQDKVWLDQIAKEIHDLKVQVKKVGDRSARYQTGQHVSKRSHVSVDRRALVIFEDSSKLVGLDKPKNEIVRLLTEHDEHLPSLEPKLISIVGLGGLGKTTLANNVYQELKEKFNCGAFISVSRNPDIMKVLRNIFCEVSKKPYASTKAGDIPQLIQEIKNFLQDKRYLIIVDDVWDVKAWETIKFAFPKNNHGSRIITTTRIHNVAGSCCGFHEGSSVYKLKPLSDVDSKTLFLKRIFGREDKCPDNLNTVCASILKKCGGLPLAIITISGLLATKARDGLHSMRQWETVESCICHGLGRHDSSENMTEILSLSYYDLPFHSRSCFLYLSIFPEDYVVEKKQLVRAWDAEGFISANSNDGSLYESGDRVFNDLINRSLILAQETTKFGEVTSCRVHDIILDFIVLKSEDQNFVTVGKAQKQKIRRVALHDDNGGATLASNPNFESLRSLFTFGYSVGFLDSIMKFNLLRVLDLQYLGSLEDKHLTNIGELFLLKYLGLRGTFITLVPEQIGRLQNLQTLDVSDCRIQELPKAITQLRKLSHLLINDAEDQELWQDPVCMNLPSGIRDMQALEVLKHVRVYLEQPLGFLEEIGELTNISDLAITWEYYLDYDDKDHKAIYKKHSKTMLSSISRLNKLNSLYVSFPFDYDWESFIISGDDFLHEIRWCPASLRTLDIECCFLLEVPRWMCSLQNLNELWIPLKKIGQGSLDILGGLPILVDLHLHVIDEWWEEEDEDTLLESYESSIGLEEGGMTDEGEELLESYESGIGLEEGGMTAEGEELLESGDSGIPQQGDDYCVGWISHIMKIWACICTCLCQDKSQNYHKSRDPSTPNVRGEEESSVAEGWMYQSFNQGKLLVSKSHGFPKLRYMEIGNKFVSRRTGIPMLIFEEGSMPNLEELRIEIDSDITCSVTNSHYDFGLEHLTHLNYVNIKIFGGTTTAWSVDAAIRRAIDKNLNHPRLQMDTYADKTPPTTGMYSAAQTEPSASTGAPEDPDQVRSTTALSGLGVNMDLKFAVGTHSDGEHKSIARRRRVRHKHKRAVDSARKPPTDRAMRIQEASVHFSGEAEDLADIVAACGTTDPSTSGAAAGPPSSA